jgi:hypothetical protein
MSGSFEQKILDRSGIKERNLLRPAGIAMVKPDTGVEIKNKSAYYVIRDCATLAHDYVALKCYSSFSDPVRELAGVFDKQDIIDFVARTRDEPHTKQLLYIIFSDIYKLEAASWTPPEPIKPVSQPLEIDADADHDEIYGDYGYGDTDAPEQQIELPIEAPVDLGDGEEVVEKLLQAFGVG